jgi:hypothetical protein
MRGKDVEPGRLTQAYLLSHIDLSRNRLRQERKEQVVKSFEV